jgi:hypothetical protein
MEIMVLVCEYMRWDFVYQFLHVRIWFHFVQGI